MFCAAGTARCPSWNRSATIWGVDSQPVCRRPGHRMSIWTAESTGLPFPRSGSISRRTLNVPYPPLRRVAVERRGGRRTVSQFKSRQRVSYGATTAHTSSSLGNQGQRRRACLRPLDQVCQVGRRIDQMSSVRSLFFTRQSSCLRITMTHILQLWQDVASTGRSSSQRPQSPAHPGPCLGWDGEGD